VQRLALEQSFFKGGLHPEQRSTSGMDHQAAMQFGASIIMTEK
jgi:hypothetical protein